MKPHEERVMQEYTELFGRAERLQKFLDGEKYLGLPPEDRALLRLQYATMRMYLDILQERMDRFEVDDGTSRNS